MESIKLRKDAISQPQLWRLAFELDHENLSVALFPPTSNESPIYERFSLNLEEKSHVKGLEEIIYDNPLLLSEFKQIDFLIGTDKFLLVPFIDDQYAERLMLKAFTSDMESEYLKDIVLDNAMILYVIDPTLISFLRRTFFGVKIRHRLVPLTNYLRKSLREKECLVLNINGKSMDIVAFSENTLLAYNSYQINSDLETLYYTLAVIKSTALEKPAIYIRNSNPNRQETNQLINNYLTDIRPLMTADDILSRGKGQSEVPLTLQSLAL